MYAIIYGNEKWENRANGRNYLAFDLPYKIKLHTLRSENNGSILRKFLQWCDATVKCMIYSKGS